MNDISKQIINELKLQIFSEESSPENLVVLFPGNFQPMTRLHKMQYDWLVKKFGKEKIYIVTTDKTDIQRYPLSFEEKKKIINKYGIDNVIKVTMPLNVSNVVDVMELDPQKTVLIYAVDPTSKKEMKAFKHLMTYNKTTHLPIKDIGNPYVYYVTPPEIGVEIPGFGPFTDENVYKALCDREAKLAELKSRFESIMGWLDAELFNMLISKFNTNRGKLKEDIQDWFRALSNMTEIQAQMFFDILKKEYGDTKDLLPIIQKYIKTGKVSKEETKIFQQQMKDNLKLLGLGAIAAIPIPGTMLLIPVIVQLAKKFNINLLPTIKEEPNFESLPIVKREFWNEVFTEVAKEEEKEKLTEVIQIPSDLRQKIEEAAIETFLNFAKKITPDMNMGQIIHECREFIVRQETPEGLEKTIDDVNDWIFDELKLFGRLENVKLSAISFAGTQNFEKFTELTKLFSYCYSNDCESVAKEIDYLFDENYDSPYEQEEWVNYDNFYKQMDSLKNYYSYTGNAVIRIPDRYYSSLETKISLDLYIVSLSVHIVLIKAGIFKNKTVETLIKEFVKKSYTPSFLHELTHLIQLGKEFVNSNKNKSSEYQNMNPEDPKYWETYLSDKKEIGAHATQFVQDLRANFPSKTDAELLKMIQTNDIPTGTSWAYQHYYDQFFKQVVKDKTDPVKMRFLKTVYQLLSK